MRKLLIKLINNIATIISKMVFYVRQVMISYASLRVLFLGSAGAFFNNYLGLVTFLAAIPLEVSSLIILKDLEFCTFLIQQAEQYINMGLTPENISAVRVLLIELINALDVCIHQLKILQSEYILYNTNDLYDKIQFHLKVKEKLEINIETLKNLIQQFEKKQDAKDTKPWLDRWGELLGSTGTLTESVPESVVSVETTIPNVSSTVQVVKPIASIRTESLIELREPLVKITEQIHTRNESFLEKKNITNRYASDVYESSTKISNSLKDNGMTITNGNISSVQEQVNNTRTSIGNLRDLVDPSKASLGQSAEQYCKMAYEALPVTKEEIVSDDKLVKINENLRKAAITSREDLLQVRNFRQAQQNVVDTTTVLRSNDSVKQVARNIAAIKQPLLNVYCFANIQTNSLDTFTNNAATTPTYLSELENLQKRVEELGKKN